MEHNLKIYMLFYRPIALVWLVITVKIYIYILSVWHKKTSKKFRSK